eukprot:m51a1_g14118 hypothetical protein (230) ;mRNA; f:170439-176258
MYLMLLVYVGRTVTESTPGCMMFNLNPIAQQDRLQLMEHGPIYWIMKLENLWDRGSCPQQQRPGDALPLSRQGRAGALDEFAERYAATRDQALQRSAQCDAAARDVLRSRSSAERLRDLLAAAAADEARARQELEEAIEARVQEEARREQYLFKQAYERRVAAEESAQRLAQRLLAAEAERASYRAQALDNTARCSALNDELERLQEELGSVRSTLRAALSRAPANPRR